MNTQNIAKINVKIPTPNEYITANKCRSPTPPQYTIETEAPITNIISNLLDDIFSQLSNFTGNENIEASYHNSLANEVVQNIADLFKEKGWVVNVKQPMSDNAIQHAHGIQTEYGSLMPLASTHTITNKGYIKIQPPEGIATTAS